MQRRFNWPHITRPQTPAHSDSPPGRGGLPCTVARQPCGPRPGVPVQRGNRPVALGRDERAGHAHSMITACSSGVGRHSGALAGGPVAASRWQGVVDVLAGATGRTSGKEEGARAHQKGGSTARQRKRRRVAASNGCGVASWSSMSGVRSCSSRGTRG
jgi:hypothetical protein